MYIHCLPRKCRYPVNLQTPFMMKSESLGLPVHYYVSNSHCARTVYSLANHFTQVDNQWQMTIQRLWCNSYTIYNKIKQTLLQMLNVHSLSTQKMPTSGELTYCLHDVVKVLKSPWDFLLIIMDQMHITYTRTVFSLANDFTQVNNHRQYDLHVATTSSHTRKMKQRLLRLNAHPPSTP